MKRKAFSLLLCIAMVLTMMQSSTITAFADAADVPSVADAAEVPTAAAIQPSRLLSRFWLMYT